tara:strand:+ start:92 stop:937 length:846 start_codon:yes stop_codon:yes gene_type:complete
VFKRLYAPTFFLGFLAAALTLAGTGGSLIWLPALVVVAILTSCLAERIAPHEPVWNKPDHDRVRDICHAVVNEGTIIVLVVLLAVFAAVIPWAPLWPSSLPLWADVALSIIMLDIGITLVHFASHRMNLLWRFHAVHHSVKRMYGFNGQLKHPVRQTLEIMGGTLPWLLLGIPTEVAAIATFAVAVQLLLQHSNVDMKIGPLKYVWAVAPVHRHHHVASGQDGDVNFGLFLTLWDLLLGTARFSSCDGARAGAIGIHGRPDYPAAYAAQFVEPFRQVEIRS